MMYDSEELRQDRRTAIYYILRYSEAKRIYEDGKEEALSRPCDENAGRHGAVSHPTESAAIASVQYDAKSIAYPWLVAVEQTEKNMPSRQRIFLEVRRDAEKIGRVFRRGRKAWVPYVQRRYVEVMSERYGLERDYIGERTVRDWWYEIIDKVVDTHLRTRIKMMQLIQEKK